jgi:hypothetical protein
MKDIAKLEDLFGKTVSLITPSGYNVVIRQQTGEDDDTISNSGDAGDGTSFNKFIASIIVDSDITPSGRIMLEDVMKLKLCDKYFIIIASRIFSIGAVLKFTYKWSDIKEPVAYEDDLSQYIWDYKEEFPYEPTHTRYFESRIQPHPFKKETQREFTINSGKKLRYTFLNGEGERYLVKLPSDVQSKNQELLARNLEWYVPGEEKWTKVQNFKFFSSLDMVEIRREITLNDPAVDLISELENPVTHDKIPYPIVGTQDFFFPREI